MADTAKTCANCGHTQATGDFCEACGTRLPAAPAAAPPQFGVPPSYGTPPPPSVPPPPSAPPSYGTPPPPSAPPQYGAPQQGVPQYDAPQARVPQAPPAPYAAPQYAAEPRRPREDVWAGLADFTFRRFPTPGLARLAWIATLVWVALSLIVSLWVISDNWAGGLSVFRLLAALAVAAFTVVIVRVGLEAMLALHRIREKKDQS